ncbi:MAG: sigma-70 family RNA polymerase sigma factor [Candidatus Poribacteria bacterium]|nr:sigma-70 family RNA polymerase sigma factor [Candidatus Poribacteria bacterium]
MKNVDVELIQRVLDGDDTAFSELVRKYQKSVHALAWRKTQDFHIAEDITQETFLRAYQNLPKLKESQSFASWLYVIATNHCKTWLSKKQLRTQSLDNFNSAELEKATYSTYVSSKNERSTAEAKREIVKKLLAKLQESDRTVITLYYLGGMTYEEISRFLGVSVSAIKSRLYRARQLLKKEEPMIREALQNYQITPQLTENIMREVKRLKPTAPTGGKPLVPWAVTASSAILIGLLLGLGSQQLVHFQKSYSLDAQAETTVELVDTPIAQNINAKPDVRSQIGSPNASDKNNGAGQQTEDTASLDLDTIIAKMKQYDNVVTSITGDFIIERHRNYEISGKPPPFGNLSIERNIEPKIKIDEYKLTFDGEKVRVDSEGFRPIEFWDGKQHWEVTSPGPHNLLFKVEIAPNKEMAIHERIKHALKQVGIELADDVRIVNGELPNSFRIIEKDKTYFVLFVGETVAEVYKHNVGYAVRSYWAISMHDADPRWWLTFPRDGSDNTYLSEPLWHLLEKCETEILGIDVLEGGEKTTVIRLTKAAWNIGDRKIPPRHLKLWISHDKGFRLVKSEEEYVEKDTREWNPFKAGVTYIRTRKIEYHEYLPDVWFPKRIERSIVPKVSLKKQDGGNVLFKNVLLTKQCQLNTDVSKLLRLDISPDTSIDDFGVNRLHTVGELETKPNFQIQLGSTFIPSKNDQTVEQVSDHVSQDLLQKHLPKGAKTRIGKGRANDIAYSSDGTRLAVASSIGIWIYDAHTGKALNLLTGHTNRVLNVTFSQDGRTLASESKSSIRLWDARTGTHLRTITQGMNSTTGLVFSADGKTLVSGSKDNTIRLWNIQTDTPQKTLIGHTDKVMSVTFSPDGKTIASASKDNTIRLWDTQSGEIRKTRNLDHPQDIYKMAFSADGKTLASWVFEGPIRLWDVKTTTLLHTLPLEQMDYVNEFAFSQDGKMLASAMNNGLIHLWNVQTGERHRILIGHTHWALDVAFSPDSKTLVSGSFDSTIRFWDVQTGKHQKTLTGHVVDITYVAFSPDGKTLVNAIEDNTIRLWDAQTGKLRHILNTQDMASITGVAFSPDGKRSQAETNLMQFVCGT